MIEDWKQRIDTGKMVATISVDLSKTFHSLPHGLLIAELSAYGVYSGSLLLVICVIAIKGLNWAM